MAYVNTIMENTMKRDGGKYISADTVSWGNTSSKGFDATGIQGKAMFVNQMHVLMINAAACPLCKYQDASHNGMNTQKGIQYWHFPKGSGMVCVYCLNFRFSINDYSLPFYKEKKKCMIPENGMW